jgi:rod shape determining protein RodA
MALADLAHIARPGADTSRRDPSAPWRHVDVLLVVCALAVASLGVLMVYSATRGPEPPYATSYLVRQSGWVAVGAVLAMVVAVVDYRQIRDFAPFLYGGAVALLALVVSPLGDTSKGAQAWFAFGPFQLQPSEVAKPAVIVALASLLSTWEGAIDLRRLAGLLALAGAPMALIMLQPDLGTVLVFVSFTGALLLVGGVRGRYLLALGLLGVLGVVGVLRSDALADYQKDRLTAFANPDADTQDSTYNLRNSIAAVANGRLTGEGLFEGTQTQLNFVPEQQTDFIFTVVAEELGFAGAATLLGLYSIIAWRIWRTAKLARDAVGSLICVGVLAMLAFQVFESVGMATGIMPVTGIPLPFLSYGGSSTIASCIAIGLVLNVHMRRYR